MKNKIITVIITMPFAELLSNFFQSPDRITDFIPFLQTIQGGRFHVSAYDFFIMLSIFALTIIYQFSHTTPKACIQEIQSILSNMQALDIAVCAGVGVAMHFFVCPLLYNLFSDPINVLSNAHDAIRRTAMVTLPFLWLLSIRIANEHLPGTRAQSMPSNQFGMPMISPP